MGFLSGIVNTAVNSVNSTLGTNFSVGSSSSSSGASPDSWEGKFLANKNFQTAKDYLIYKKAYQLFVNERKPFTVFKPRSVGAAYWTSAIAYYNTTAGIAEVNALLSQSSSVTTSSSLQNTLNNILTNATQTALQAGETAVANIIDKNLGSDTKPGNSLADSLGNIGAAILDKSTKEWFKKNWYYIILPPVLVIAYFVYRNSNSNNEKGKRSYKKK